MTSHLPPTKKGCFLAETKEMMKNMVDVAYKELPSHVRVVMGADLEYKCNKIIGEEVNDGFLLFKTSCGVAYSEGQDQTVVVIVLGFRKMYPNEREGKRGIINRV